MDKDKDNSQNEERSAMEKIVGNIKRQREEELTKDQAGKLKLAYRDLVGFQPNPAVVGIVPKELANTGEVFAFDKEEHFILLALTDPTNIHTQDALKKLSALDKYSFKPVLVSKSSIDYLLSVYDTFAPTEVKQDNLEISSKTQAAFDQIKDFKLFQDELAKASTSDVLEIIFAGATGLEASDIHIEPGKEHVRLRYRLDGVLQDVAELPSPLLMPMINRIKMMASLKLNIKESSQDGRFSIKAGDTDYDIRVSILPTQYGESAVMRLLPQKGKFVALNELGLSPADKAMLDEVIHEPNGLILNTGPTGSGKTTTLYSILNTINSPTTKIITIEDPIEYKLKGVTQTQVNPEEHYDFANALRSLMRQDPDVILVGEIRDTDTANIAVDASLTGHLVLSTLHTNDATGAIPRLTELGAKPNLFADALRLIIAQRLMRKVCTKCREAYKPSGEEISKIRSTLPGAEVPTELYRAKGCDACNGTGYKGRVGIFELLKITPEIKDKIAANLSAHEIRELAIQQNMTTLAQDGMQKVLDGITTLEELDRVIE